MDRYQEVQNSISAVKLLAKVKFCLGANEYQ